GMHIAVEEHPRALAVAAREVAKEEIGGAAEEAERGLGQSPILLGHPRGIARRAGAVEGDQRLLQVRPPGWAGGLIGERGPRRQRGPSHLAFHWQRGGLDRGRWHPWLQADL